MNENNRLWLARILIALVTAWNLQAALTFILWPGRYAPGFELSGIPGAVAVRGTGILFLMWNVPYLVALWHPQKYRLALGLALIMQFIGLTGESFMRASLGSTHTLLQSSIWHFIIFDASGLVILIIAFLTIKRKTRLEEV